MAVAAAVVVVLAATLGTILGNQSTKEVFTEDATSTAGTTAGEGAVDSGESDFEWTSLEEMEAGEFEHVMMDAADQLIGRLGGDEPAFYAVLLALDRGYYITQLVGGALEDMVEPDGRIVREDGSVVPSALPPEGVIQPAAASGSDGAGVSTARPSARPILVTYRTRSPLLVADSSDGYMWEATIVNKLLPIADVYQMGRELLLGQMQLIEQQEDQQELEVLIGRVVTLAMHLGARGYGAEQIVEGILLGQIGFTFGDLEVMDEPYPCFYLQHTSGVILRPVNPPTDVLGELGCPGFEQDAPTSFPPEEVQAAIAAATEGATSRAEGGSTDIPAAPGASKETPSADLDGIQDGIYRGEVYYIGQSMSGAGFFEFPESTVELVVTDEGVSATVEFIQRWSAYANETEVTCIATVHMRSVGQGPVTNPLSLTMEPVVQEAVGLEGDCGDYQETLDQWATSNQTRTLAGTFSDGHFEGTMDNPYGVRADTIGD